MALGTPYVTPAMLLTAPTGMPWDSIPEPQATEAAMTAELTNICWRATSIVDTYCNQVLRATVDNEYLTGPGAPRLSVQNGSCNGLLVMRRWPISQVLAIQTSPNRAFPRTWTTVPAGQYEIDHPLINSSADSASATAPDGGSSITLAPGWILPLAYGGRNSTRALVSYINGWPHTSLTANASVGATSLAVDDVTGWAGALGFVYDGAATEPVSVTSVSATTPVQLPNGVGTAQSGPGTITLSSPLTNAHLAGTVVSALPQNALWATFLAAAAQVLESGTTSVAVQNIAGSLTTGGHGVADLATEYELLLEPFRRVI